MLLLNLNKYIQVSAVDYPWWMADVRC